MMLKKIFIALIVILLILVVVGFLLPSKVHVERTTTVNAPAATLYALTNGFRGFNRWSPWHERDPNAQYSFEGPETGVGAKMSWTSDVPEVGNGSQEIVSSQPNKRVDAHLDFGDQGTAESFFTYETQGDQTKVTWGFDTDLGSNLIARYMGLMFDKWIGPDYEKGLNNLKQVAESMPKVDFSSLKPEILDMEPIMVAFISAESPPDSESISTALGASYGKIIEFMQANSLQPTGMPITINTNYGGDVFAFDAAIPVASEPVELDESSEVKFGKTPSGKSLRFIHPGPYAGMTESYGKIQAYLEVHVWETAERSWAQYTNDPGSTPEAELETHIYFPVK